MDLMIQNSTLYGFFSHTSDLSVSSALVGAVGAPLIAILENTVDDIIDDLIKYTFNGLAGDGGDWTFSCETPPGVYITCMLAADLTLVGDLQTNGPGLSVNEPGTIGIVLLALFGLGASHRRIRAR